MSTDRHPPENCRTLLPGSSSKGSNAPRCRFGREEPGSTERALARGRPTSDREKGPRGASPSSASPVDLPTTAGNAGSPPCPGLRGIPDYRHRGGEGLPREDRLREGS